MIRNGTFLQKPPQVFMPAEVTEAWKLKHQFGSEACYVAGATLLQTNWEKGGKVPSQLISLEFIEEMHGWQKDLLYGEPYTRIGALTSLDSCRHHPAIKLFSLLPEAARNIAAPGIRSRATIGGNVLNPFGDTIPALIVMDAQLLWFAGDDYVLTSINEFICKGIPNDSAILVALYLPEQMEGSNESTFYKKLGFREAFSPSIITISGRCKLGNKEEVETIRLAVGGSNTPPQRLLQTEKLLKEFGLTAESFKTILQSIKEEFTPITDNNFSADYKKTVAANLIVYELSRLAG